MPEASLEEYLEVNGVIPEECGLGRARWRDSEVKSHPRLSTLVPLTLEVVVPVCPTRVAEHSG